MAAEGATRLAGWLIDQEHGLLPYAPVYFLVPAGWLSLWKRDRPLCAALTLVIAAYVGVMTVPLLNAHGWRGGWSPAARFLVPVAPFLCILLFAGIARVRLMPAPVWMLVAVQVAIDAILWQHPGLLWNDGVGSSALLTFLDGSGRLSALVPSLVPPVTTRTVRAIVAIAAGWLLFTAWLVRYAARRRGPLQNAYFTPR
jgi:hypothetical protein